MSGLVRSRELLRELLTERWATRPLLSFAKVPVSFLFWMGFEESVDIVYPKSEQISCGDALVFVAQVTADGEEYLLKSEEIELLLLRASGNSDTP